MKTSLILCAMIVSFTALLGGAELRLTAPNGGEELCLGRPARITWSAAGVAARVKLQLIRSGGALVGVIATNLDPAAQAFDWPLAGQHAGGTAAAGTNYKVRVSAADGTLADESDSAFTLKACAASGPHPAGDLQVMNPDLQLTRAPQPPLEVRRAPDLRIRELKYDYSAKCFEAWVKNMGNAPFVGRFHWQWITECGAREANKDIPPEQSPLLESASGMHLGFPCEFNSGACSAHASFAIEPIGQDGTRYAPVSAQVDAPAYEQSQFLMSEGRLLLRFLHGQHWVDFSREYVIVSGDAFNYDPQARTATFTIGFPVRNCGSQAGRSDHAPARKLYWSVFHSPSNTMSVYPRTVSNGPNYAGSPIEPGHGVLVERSVTLPVRSGIYMLHVHGGSDPAGLQFGVISIRFAAELLH